MIRSNSFPQKIYVEKRSLDYPLAKRILDNAGRVPLEVIDNPQDLIEDMKSSRDAVNEGKKYLLITRQRGRFIKPCPCTPHHIGCNYFIINLELNCPLGCTYCVLQHYLKNPLITIYVNLEDLWRELDAFLGKNKRKILRIGTGELADSLALDHLTDNSRGLISYFREKSSAIFELKTKTVNIKNVLELEPARNIVISWSLSSSRIAREEERGAPSVLERIDAARKVSESGFWVGFHFDPIIRCSGWEEDYEKTIMRLLEAVAPSRVAWISLGSLRFIPFLKVIIKERFPETKIIYDEFIKGKDGKIRYFRPIRLELYRKIISFIKTRGGERIPLYFCMETGDVWRDVMGWVPARGEDLGSHLAFSLDQSRR